MEKEENQIMIKQIFALLGEICNPNLNDKSTYHELHSIFEYHLSKDEYIDEINKKLKTENFD